MPGIMVQQQQDQQQGDAGAIKAELRKLMDQRDAMEREINERSERLNAPGGGGLEGSLVDKQVRGFVTLPWQCTCRCL